MGIHDDVRTNARVTEWHVFLRDDQAADTWGREDFGPRTANRQEGRAQNWTGISSLPFLSLLLSNLLRGLYQELTKAISKRPARQTVRNNCPGGKALQPVDWPAGTTHSVPLAAGPASPATERGEQSWPRQEPWSCRSAAASLCVTQLLMCHTQVPGMRVLWPPNTESWLSEGVFKLWFWNLGQGVLVRGRCADGSTHWLLSPWLGGPVSAPAPLAFPKLP